MKFKLQGSKTFFKNKNWEKRGSEYVRVKKHTDDDIQRFKAEIKNVKSDPTQDPASRELVIYGVANSNIVDRMDERLDPRGLDLQDFMRNPVLLAYHDHQRPIGKVLELDIQEDGVYFTGKVGFPEKAKLTDDQIEIRSLIEQGILSAVSVGFIPKRVKFPEETTEGDILGEFVITEWELLELSIVSVPANQGSLFDVKNCKNIKDGAKVKADSSKSSKESQGTFMLKKLKALKALLIKSKNLVDAEIDDQKSQAKLTFIIDDIKSIEDLETLIKAQEDAEDSKEGMAEALTLLRSIGSDLKQNNEMTKEIRLMMDKPNGGSDSDDETDEPAKALDNIETKDGDEETPPVDEETPPVDEETPPADEETPPADEETPPADTKDIESRLKDLESSYKEFQDSVTNKLDQIGEILAVLAKDA
jgi:HK97 family phage prohead protease